MEALPTERSTIPPNPPFAVRFGATSTSKLVQAEDLSMIESALNEIGEILR